MKVMFGSVALANSFCLLWLSGCQWKPRCRYQSEDVWLWVTHTCNQSCIRQLLPKQCMKLNWLHDQDHINDHATQSAAYHDSHCKQKSPLYAGQTVSVFNDAKTLWLPTTVICQAKHGTYLVQVIGGGQYRCAHDHIHKCHPDAVKPDRSTITDVAPATPECSPGMAPVRLAPAASITAPVAEATTPPNLVAPATTPHTPRKSVVHTPQLPQNPSTGDVPNKTGAASTATHWSSQEGPNLASWGDVTWNDTQRCTRCYADPDCPWLTNI